MKTKEIIITSVVGASLLLFGAPKANDLVKSKQYLDKEKIEKAIDESTIKEKYKFKNDKLVLEKKGDRPEILIGDGLEPGLEFKKWDTNFKLKPRSKKIKSLSTKDKEITYDDGESKYRFYDLDDKKAKANVDTLERADLDTIVFGAADPEIDLDDAYEFEIELSKAPQDGIVEMDIETENLKFLYQDALNIEMASTTCTPTLCGEVSRPENVVGSYAVYHETKEGDLTKLGGENYKAGKVFHIYRPKLIDANGDWIWGELYVDTALGILRITGDTSWYSKAAYPVIVDPTFGFTSIGGSSYTTNTDYVIGGIFTAPEDGIIESISFYNLSGTYDDGPVRVGVYVGPDQYLISGNSGNVSLSAGAWVSDDLESEVKIESGEEYTLSHWSEEASMRYDTLTNGAKRESDAFPSDWWNSYMTGTLSYKLSIYATYTTDISTGEFIIGDASSAMYDVTSYLSHITAASARLSTTTYVFAYDYDEDSSGRAIIASSSGSSIEFGTSSAFSASSSNITETVKMDESTFGVIYTDGSYDLNYVIVGIVSGTSSISWTNRVLLPTNNASSERALAALSSTKLVACYPDADTDGECAIITLSGSTISLGSGYEHDTIYYNYGNIIGVIDETHFVVTFYDNKSGGTLDKRIGTVSGSSISYGTRYDYDLSLSSIDLDKIVEVSDDKFLMLGSTGYSPATFYAHYFSISGSTVTVEDHLVLDNLPTDWDTCDGLVKISESTFVVGYFTDSFNMGLSRISINGSDELSQGSIVHPLIGSSIRDYSSEFEPIDSEKFIYMYHDSKNSTGRARIITLGDIVDTSAATAISQFTATLNGSNALVEETAMEVYFRYGTASDTYTATTTLEYTEASAAFDAVLTNLLDPSTTYYFRAYGRGTSTGSTVIYEGAEESFITSSYDPVTTTEVSNVDQTSARFNGTIDDMGKFAEIDLCFMYGIEAFTATSSCDTLSGTGAGFVDLTGLTTFSVYQYRAFASTSDGIWYDDTTIEFFTADVSTTTDTTIDWNTGTLATTTAEDGSLKLDLIGGGGGTLTFLGSTEQDQSTSGTTWTRTHSCQNGTSRAVIIAINVSQVSTDNIVTAVSYDGVSATKIEDTPCSACSSDPHVSLWFLNEDDLSCTAGTYNLVATLSASEQGETLMYWFDGASQDVPTNYLNIWSINNDVATYENTITDTTDGSIILDQFYSEYTGDNATVGAGQTEIRADEGVPNEGSAYSSREASSGGDVTMTWNNTSNSGGWEKVHMVVEVEVGGEATTTSGYRISDPLDVGIIESVDASIIEWATTTAASSTAEFYALINSSTSTPPAGVWDLVSNGGSIPDATGDLSGKYLWTKIDLTSIDGIEQPTVEWLRYGINDGGATSSPATSTRRIIWIY